MSDTPGEELSPTFIDLIDELCDRFERAWVSGARPRIEDSLGQVPVDARPQCLQSLLHVELELRRRAGELPHVNDYAAPFPDSLAVVRATLQESPAAAPQLTNLGSYRLLEKIGEGGMGAVYRALHEKLRKTVAVKVLPPGFLQSKAALARFEREMQSVGGLNHPNIVQALDAGEFHGTHFLVMEYLDGRDLSCLVREAGPLAWPNACRLIQEAARGLAHAHENHLVHRDIKPSNLFLTRAGHVKVLDLGLSRSDSSEDLGSDLTATGQSMGTPDYMAPEQWDDSSRVSPRTDLYALGCSLFFLLAGRAPYATEQYRTSVRKMSAHHNAPIPDLRSLCPAVPPDLEALCRQLLAKDPADRIGSAAELVAALEPFSSAEKADFQLVPLRQVQAGTPTVLVADFESAVTRPARRGAPRRVFAALAGVAVLLALAAVALLPGSANWWAPAAPTGIDGEAASGLYSNGGETPDNAGAIVAEDTDSNAPESSDGLTPVAHKPDAQGISQVSPEQPLPRTQRAANGQPQVDSGFLIEPGQTVELVPSVVPRYDAYRDLETWSRSPTGLVGETAHLSPGIESQLFLPVELSKQAAYELTSRFRLLRGSEGILFGLPASGKVLLVSIAAMQADGVTSHSGIEPRKGAALHDSSTAGSTFRFVNGQAYTLVLRLEPKQEGLQISAHVDDAVLFETLVPEDELHEAGLSPAIEWQPSPRILCQRPMLSLQQRDVLFESITLRMDAGTGTPLRSAPRRTEHERAVSERWVEGAAGYELPGLLPHPAKFPGVFRWNIETRTPRHDGHSVDWSRTGQIAVGTREGNIRIYSGETGELEAIFPAGQRTTSFVRWSPQGDRLAAAGPDGRAVWDRAGHCLNSWPWGGITGVDWSFDGALLASADKVQGIQIHSAEGAELAKFTGHVSLELRLAWSPVENVLASISPDQTLRIWKFRLETPELAQVPVSSGWGSLSWSPDGLQLAITDSDKIRVFAWKSGQLTERQAWTSQAIGPVAWSPDGRWIATPEGFAGSAKIRLWAPDGKPGTALENPEQISRGIAWSPDSQRIASAGDGVPLRIWRTTGEQAFEVAILPRVSGIDWDPNQECVATIDSNSDIRSWQLDGTSSSVAAPARDLNGLAWQPGGDLLALATRTGDLYFAGPKQQPMVGPLAFGDTINVMRWSASGAVLALANWTGRKLCLVRPDGSTTDLAAHAEQIVSSLAWNPQQEILASSGHDRTIRLWTSEGVPLFNLSTTPILAGSLTWSPDGTVLYGTSGGEVYSWQLDGTTLAVRNSKTLSWTCGVMSCRPDGDRLAIAVHDNTLGLYDREFELAGTQYFRAGGIEALAWSPDGRHVSGLGQDRTVRLWDGTTAELQWVGIRFGSGQLGSGQRDSELPLVFSPAGELLHGDPAVAERECVYLTEMGDGRIATLTRAQFREQATRGLAPDDDDFAADRRAARRVIELGAGASIELRLQNRILRPRKLSDLPAESEPYRVIAIRCDEGAPISDADLAQWCDLRFLERLQLAHSPVLTPTGIAHLHRLKSLRKLVLKGAWKVDAEFVQMLRTIPRLDALSLQELTDVNPQTPGVLEQLRVEP